MKTAILSMVVLLTSASAWAAEAPFGAVTTAPLPRGGLAVYGMGGYPEFRAGFRQGYSQYEIGGEVGLDYLATDFFGTVTARRTLWTASAMNLALDGRLGIFANAGSRWVERENRSGVGLRFELGTSFTYKTTWPLSWLAFIKVPGEIPFTKEGSVRLSALLGGGAEVALTREYFLHLNGAFGAAFQTHLPERLAVQAMVGFGYRVF